MTTFMGFFFAENMTSAEFAPMMAMVAVIAIVCNGLLWNIGLPALAMRFLKPVGRTAFYRNIFLYTLVIAVLGALIACGYYQSAKDSYFFDEESLEILKNIYIIESAATPVIFGSIAAAALTATRAVDRKMPERFRRAPAVKVTVTETEPVTAVEYMGKRYVLSKCFYVKLRDKIKVRILEDEEKAYLK